MIYRLHVNRPGEGCMAMDSDGIGEGLAEQCT